MHIDNKVPKRSLPRVVFWIAEGWSARSSGVYTFVRSLVPALQSQSNFKIATFPVEISHTNHTGTKQNIKISYQGRLIPSGRLLLGYIKMLYRSVRCVWLARGDLNSNVLLLNDFGAEVRPIACRLILPFSKLVLIAHTHPNQGKDYWVRRLFEKLCYAACTQVVFNSYALKIMWEDKLQRPLNKGIVIHHGIDVSVDYSLPREYPLKVPGVVDVVCVGLFYEWKGQLALIDAWPEVLRHCKVPLRLVFVGEGTVYEAACQKVSVLGLRENILFLGQQEYGANFFNGADIAIHYPTEPEAFGLVLLEAMARGKPVIASAHGGATEIVVDGETGYLVRPGVSGEWDVGQYSQTPVAPQSLMRNKESDSGGRKPNVPSQIYETRNQTSLVDAVCRLAEDAGLRQRMGEAGHTRARTEFSLEKMRENWESLLNQSTQQTFGRFRGGVYE